MVVGRGVGGVGAVTRQNKVRGEKVREIVKEKRNQNMHPDVFSLA